MGEFLARPGKRGVGDHFMARASKRGDMSEFLSRPGKRAAVEDFLARPGKRGVGDHFMARYVFYRHLSFQCYEIFETLFYLCRLVPPEELAGARRTFWLAQGNAT